MNGYTKPTDDDLFNIVISGKDYNPAWKHYGKRMQVTCDGCKRSTLVSRGLGKRDLCPNCVNKVKKLIDEQNEQNNKKEI